MPWENTRDSTTELIIDMPNDVLQELKEKLTLRKLVEKIYETEKLCRIPITSERLIDYKQPQEDDKPIEYTHDIKQYDNTRLRNHVARRTAIGAKHTGAHRIGYTTERRKRRQTERRKQCKYKRQRQVKLY
ncbi:unnamed protein product [Didymodactylos carnosus]|uniref:Uncharacterized protein n=1 Tax=Didymodactylos carnosus TaxID=1234261 RepID=A0A814ES97_9BILA|nr:unnamed protein product [Didymodactylos carnosus]CAF0971292.1 unnamed protein product [Didymodactylos carnosus]CAF3571841.1 unnamed protein product [Didymodactylos carnosus]CAF3744318.1 unnamed protein product [Didymodactylos carnosus]